LGRTQLVIKAIGGQRKLTAHFLYSHSGVDDDRSALLDHTQRSQDHDVITEQKLLLSGLTYTLAKHPPFLDVLGFYIGTNAHETGIRVPAGTGKFARLPATIWRRRMPRS
jgi:hypothetical protein